MNAMVATNAPRPVAQSVLHLVRFDLRRFRMLVLLMVGLELARAAFVEWSVYRMPARIDARFGGPFGRIEIEFFDLSIWLAVAVTAAIIVQADLPSDDRAFWRTRPIAPLTLALAKLTTMALLFVAVPSVINGTHLLAHGSPVASVTAAAAQIAVQAVSTVVPAWALAVMTRTLPRFIGGAIGGYVGILAVWSAALFWASKLFASSVGALGPALIKAVGDWQRIEMLGWGMALAISVAALAILIRHYQHGRPALSLTAAAILFLAPMFLPARDPAAPASPELARIGSQLGVVGIWPPAGPQTAPETPMPARDAVPIQILFTLPALPTDVSAAVSMNQARLRVGGIDRVVRAEQCCFSGGPLAVIAPALAAPRSPEGFHAAPATGTVMAILERERMRGTPISIDAGAEIRFQRHRLVEVHPLRTGTTIRRGNRVIEFLAVEPRAAVLVRYTQFPSFDGTSEPELSLFIGDRARTRVSATTPGWLGPQQPMQALTRGGRWVRGREWTGRFYVFVEGGAGWPPDAQLFVVESRDAGTTRSRLSIPDVKAWIPRQEAPR